jgi:hypothetical protein
MSMIEKQTPWPHHRRRRQRCAVWLAGVVAVFPIGAALPDDDARDPTPVSAVQVAEDVGDMVDASPGAVEIPFLEVDEAFEAGEELAGLLAGDDLVQDLGQEADPREPTPVVPEEVLGRRDLQVIERLFENGLRAMFRQPPPAAVLNDVPVPVARERRRQVEQQAKQMEQFFQPTLQTELEMIRQSCASLSPEVRRQILTAGRQAVSRTALEFAARQMNGNLDRREFDPRQSIRSPLAGLVKQHATAAELAAYDQEQAQRQKRREAAARIRIVAKLDRQLDLSAAQREAIAADLERNWQPSWICELDDQAGMVINNYRPAPDYAHASIAPHLDAAQRAEWTKWRQAAGTQLVGRQMGWNFDGQGLQQPDPWWGKDK